MRLLELLAGKLARAVLRGRGGGDATLLPDYHPLLLFDGETDQLITAVLRPGTCHASRGIVPILRRVVRAMRARWPGVQIEFRGDSGFAIPALYTWCEQEGIDYTIGLMTNERLEAIAAPLLAEATRRQEETGEKVRLAGEAQYAAGSGSMSAVWSTRPKRYPRDQTPALSSRATPIHLSSATTGTSDAGSRSSGSMSLRMHASPTA